MKTIPVSFLIAGVMLPAVCLAEPPHQPLENQRQHPPKAHRPFLEAWKLADTNHDGFLTREEFGKMPRLQKLPEEKREMLFLRMDKNRDDQVSRDELAHLGRPHDGPPDHPAKRLWELDVDQSGGVSLEEFKAGPIFKKLSPEKQQRVFARLDTDGDGIITPKDKPEPPRQRPGGKPRPDRPDGPPPEDEAEPGQINHNSNLNDDESLSALHL